MSVSLKQILEMPNAAILAEQINTALEQEKQKRLKFYEIIDENQKMEFINGEIIFHSPAKLRHVSVVSLLLRLLGVYVDKHRLGFVGGEKMLISLTRNDYEPDLCFFGVDKAQNFQPAQMQFPAPDLVVEVLSDWAAEKDRTTKFDDYAAHGIAEYWIIDLANETIEQYFLQSGDYDLLLKSNNGTIKSVCLPEFSIPVAAVFDEQTNLQTLSGLLSS